VADETGPVFLDETGAAHLVVPPPPERPVEPERPERLEPRVPLGLPALPEPPVPPGLPERPDPRSAASAPQPQQPPALPSLAPEPPRTPTHGMEAPEPPGASVWGASAQAQPGLLETGSVPQHVTWGVTANPPTPSPQSATSAPASEPRHEVTPELTPELLGEVDSDEELASALRLALSQTRRAQLPPPTRYASESWSPAEAAAGLPSVSEQGPDGSSKTEAGGGAVASPTPTWIGDGAPRTEPTWVSPAGDGERSRSSSTGGPAARDGAQPDAVPVRDAEPTWGRAVGAGQERAEERAEGRAPGMEHVRQARARTVAGPESGAGTAADTGGWEAAHAATPTARTALPARDLAPKDGRPAAAPGPEPARSPRSGDAAARPVRSTQTGAGAVAAPRAGRPASGVGQKRARTTRPALLGPRIGARLVDTAVTYSLVGVLGVVLVQRVTLHLQAKIDAAQTSGMPQTVWLVDGTVLANAGLLLAALLAVGLVYETIPLAVWGRTLGKAIFGLTVLDARSRTRPRLARAFLRTAMCQTLVFLLLGILELVPCATDRKLRQSWHDRLGGTFVVKQGG
jgi:uncharacterized RDD family membrane protein YckC